jgi:hypothetical protein
MMGIKSIGKSERTISQLGEPGLEERWLGRRIANERGVHRRR